MIQPEEIINEIEKLKQKKTLIIVEGVRDKTALETFGLSNIMVLSGKPLYEAAESVKEKEVVLLTDLDGEGKKLYAILKNIFTKTGINVDDSFRKLLSKTELRQIEGLASYLGRKNETA